MPVMTPPIRTPPYRPSLRTVFYRLAIRSVVAMMGVVMYCDVSLGVVVCRLLDATIIVNASGDGDGSACRLSAYNMPTKTVDYQQLLPVVHHIFIADDFLLLLTILIVIPILFDLRWYRGVVGRL